MEGPMSWKFKQNKLADKLLLFYFATPKHLILRQNSLWTAPRYFSQVHVGMQDSQSVRTSYQTNRSNKSLKTDINNQKKIHCALENTALVCPIRHAAVAQWPNNNNTTAKSLPKISVFHWHNSQIKTGKFRHRFVAFLENIAWNSTSVQGSPWGVNNDDGAKVLLLGEDFAVVLLLLGHCTTAPWRIGHTRALFSKAQWIF